MPYANLSALVLSRGSDPAMTLYFEDLEVLLKTQAQVPAGIQCEVDSSPNRLLIRDPAAASHLIEAWFGSPDEPSNATGTTKADRIIQMLQQPGGATADEVAEAFGIKRESAVARISVESRKRKLNVTLQDGRYHIG